MEIKNSPFCIPLLIDSTSSTSQTVTNEVKVLMLLNPIKHISIPIWSSQFLLPAHTVWEWLIYPRIFLRVPHFNVFIKLLPFIDHHSSPTQIFVGSWSLICIGNVDRFTAVRFSFDRRISIIKSGDVMSTIRVVMSLHLCSTSLEQGSNSLFGSSNAVMHWRMSEK